MDIAKIRKKAREKDGEGQVPKKEDPRPDGGQNFSAREPEVVLIPEAAALKPEGEVALITDDGSQKAEELKTENPEVSEEKTELLTFRAGGKEFAFRLASVEEIVRYQHMTRVPTLPSYVRGITSLRGKVIPVIDVGIRLGAVKAGSPDVRARGEGQGNSGLRNEKIIILAGPKGLIGALVDNVLGVVRFPEKEVLAPPAHLSEEELRFVEGVAILDKRFISIVSCGDTMDLEVT